MDTESKNINPATGATPTNQVPAPGPQVRGSAQEPVGNAGNNQVFSQNNYAAASPNYDDVSKGLYLKLAALVAIVAIVVGSSIIAFHKLVKPVHLSVANSSTRSPSSSSKPSSTQSGNNSAGSQQPAAPSSTPSTAPASPPAAAQTSVSPPPLNLGMADYERSITIPIGTTITINLPGTAGYHWSTEARSNAQWIWGNGHTVNGSDGSISYSFQALKAGQNIVGFNNNPNCYPTCNQEQPRAEWHVTLTVQ